MSCIPFKCVCLTWKRASPCVFSFSDWKLQVKIRDNIAKKVDVNNIVQNASASMEKTYHVHRSILAIGERRSGYFANLLHYGIDDGNRCSSIEISRRAADCFPDLLDFMYSSKAFGIKARNAVPLLFLSQAFQVVALERRVKSFIEKDIKLNNFGYYMSDALYFSDESMAVKVINTCEQEAMSLMNDATPSVELGLGKMLKVPLLTSAIRAERFCQSIWSLVTHKQPPLQMRKDTIRQLLFRKVPH